MKLSDLKLNLTKNIVKSYAQAHRILILQQQPRSLKEYSTLNSKRRYFLYQTNGMFAIANDYKIKYTVLHLISDFNSIQEKINNSYRNLNYPTRLRMFNSFISDLFASDELCLKLADFKIQEAFNFWYNSKYKEIVINSQVGALN